MIVNYSMTKEICKTFCTLTKTYENTYEKLTKTIKSKTPKIKDLLIPNHAAVPREPLK